ncbi:hypothetical protein RCI35_004192 [Enterobacter hormaechei]|nr:hypothetical protein [Enterobacter hormaechei]
MSNTLKEWLQQKIAEYEACRDEMPFGLDTNSAIELEAFKIALASLEAEPVGVARLDMDWATHKNVCTVDMRPDLVLSELNTGMRLYTAQPAPVSVPDERYQHLSELYHAQEKRLFKVAQRIKGPSFDKYAYSPSQAIDVLESAIFGESAEEDSRAAMLQGAENAESPTGNSTVIPDGWKLVPAELTGAMTNAMTDAILDDLHNVDVWRSVLAAAPQQEVNNDQ